MSFKEIINSFIEFNIYLDMFGDIPDKHPEVENRGVIVRKYDKYIEKVMEAITGERSEELKTVLEPFLKLKRSEIVEKYKGINNKFRETIGWGHIDGLDSQNWYTLDEIIRTDRDLQREKHYRDLLDIFENDHWTDIVQC